jgi:CRISPR/Cas system-associated protein Cas5 (RAMP superfamily)
MGDDQPIREYEKEIGKRKIKLKYDGKNPTLYFNFPLPKSIVKNAEELGKLGDYLKQIGLSPDSESLGNIVTVKKENINSCEIADIMSYAEAIIETAEKNFSHGSRIGASNLIGQIEQIQKEIRKKFRSESSIFGTRTSEILLQSNRYLKKNKQKPSKKIFWLF